MKIKAKLTLGVGFLFLLIILLSAVGAFYSTKLKNETQNVLAANYNSVYYAQNMLKALENPNPENLAFFEKNLRLQEENITEPGELEATQTLRQHFQNYRAQPNTESLKPIRTSIFSVVDMNTQAIQRKSSIAENTANNAVFWIVLTGSFCFLVAFLVLVNLPSEIANPIKELTESIDQIAKENYSERVHFEGHNEFGTLARSFNSMAEKLEEFNNSNLAKLMMEKRRIETLINQMNDPVIGLDEDSTILFVNREALKILGLENNNPIGKSAKEVAKKNDLFRNLLHGIDLSNNQNPPKPLKIFANNKESYFEKECIQISVVPTGEKSTLQIGTVIVLKNVTEYKEKDFAKTNFIATVSHEFKTPIASIGMSLQLIENKSVGQLNPEQKNLIESMKEDLGRLLKITSELLNMTQLESGNIQLAILAANPIEIIQYGIQATLHQAEQKDIRIQFDTPEQSPPVLADKEKTAWVITNLVSNAIRYSFPNSLISIHFTNLEKTVEIQVKDSGPGIPAEYKNKVFERYFRVPGSNTEGTGLGLSISKEFMEAQGGFIKLDSQLGQGCTFTIGLQKA